jgi:PIN domain nuclease of toxin-antitoxin system
MRVLVDSHAFLWAILEDAKLSAASRAIWLEQTNQLLLSPASLWEISIKAGLRKLELNRPLLQFFEEEMEKNRLELFPISPGHAATVATLPQIHRDPFDRMLVAQALCEGIAILSADQQFDAYGVTRLW